MDAIRILAACRVGDRHLAVGTVHTVPADIAAVDAVQLVRAGRAVAVARVAAAPADEKSAGRRRDKAEP